MVTYLIQKKFLNGLLEGITVDEYTPVLFKAGSTYLSYGSGSKYKVMSVKVCIKTKEGYRTI